MQELQVELQQADRKDKSYAKKKIALKKIVANMTMGNDSQFKAAVTSSIVARKLIVVSNASVTTV